MRKPDPMELCTHVVACVDDGHGKLAEVTGWIASHVSAHRGITLDALVADLAEVHNITVHRSSVWRALPGLGPLSLSCRRGRQ